MTMRDGRILRKEAFGYSDLSRKAKISVDSRFIMGSLSKQMTAMAILLLEKSGKIKPDDLAIKYVKNLPEYANSITIQHLLHHQGGLPPYDEWCQSHKGKIGNTEILDFLRTQKENKFKPGTRFSYSNSGYVVLAEIIRSASGMSYTEFMQKNIFDPLGMKKTFIITRETEPAFQKQMHSYTSWPVLAVDDFHACNYKQGPGSIVSNLDDYAKWMTAIENNTLLDDEWTQKMFTPAKLENGEATPYADGWFVSTVHDQRLFDHTGAWLSFRSYVGYLPEKKTWVALFSNYGGLDPQGLGEELLHDASK
jgi:CubicO group peptidase (beta-lactamase class C family)